MRDGGQAIDSQPLRQEKVVVLKQIRGKDDLASWVIDSLGGERVTEALKNYVSRTAVEHSEFYQTLKNKAQEIDSGDKDIDIEP